VAPYHGPVSRLRAAAGLLGPVAFTAAWWMAARRQDEYRVADEHISGLAARDANDPHVMSAGFLALGACTIAFASELDRQLGGGRRSGWGPALVGFAGACTVTAWAFRRDRRSNARGPGDPPGQSWVNDVHDAASVFSAAGGVAGLAALARRFSGDPSWDDLAGPAARAAAIGTGSTAWFLRDAVRPGNGLVQRLSITVPLAFMFRLAVRALRSGAA